MTKKIIIILSLIFVFSLVGAFIAYSATDGVDYNKKIEVNYEQIFSTNQVNQINISSTSSNINLILTDSDEIKVDYYGSLQCFICHISNKMVAKKTDGTITFKTNDYMFGFIFNNNVKMDVYFPKSYQENLYLNTVSGDLKVEDLTLGDLKIYTTSGNISMNDLNIASGKMSSVSGDIDLNQINATETLTVSTTSGDVSLDSVSTNLNFNTVSGNVNLSNFSGNISGHTTSGNIGIVLANNLFTIDLSSVSGDVIVDVNSDAPFSFNTSSISGDISIKFQYLVDGDYTMNNHKKSGTVNSDSQNYIKVNTTSGNITIK